MGSPPQSRQEEHDATQRALFSDYSPPLLRQARERQDRIIRQRFAGRRLAFADLGCGDGYHASMLAPGCEYYHAFELAPAMAQMSRERFARENLTKARIFETDLSICDLGDYTYDVVLCMYFTPGNFRDVSNDLSLYTDDYLDHNPVFTKIVGRFYRRLRPAGCLLLTVYRDNEAAEQEQWDLYRNSQQEPVTPRGSRFVATREGFWSARWTRASMLSNLRDAGIADDGVEFHELNTIAWLVEIRR